MVEIFGILALVVVAPIWIIFHYVTAWKKHRGLSNEDEKMLDEVYDVMDAMEQRLMSLERILDDEEKDWRGDEPYAQDSGSPDKTRRAHPREAR